MNQFSPAETKRNENHINRNIQGIHLAQGHNMQNKKKFIRVGDVYRTATCEVASFQSVSIDVAGLYNQDIDKS